MIFYIENKVVAFELFSPFIMILYFIISFLNYVSVLVYVCVLVSIAMQVYRCAFGCVCAYLINIIISIIIIITIYFNSELMIYQHNDVIEKLGNTLPGNRRGLALNYR